MKHDYTLAVDQLKFELKETHSLNGHHAEAFPCRDTSSRDRMEATWFDGATPYEITTPGGQTVTVPVPSDEDCATLEAAAKTRIEADQFLDTGNDHENVKTLGFVVIALMRLNGISTADVLAEVETIAGTKQRDRAAAMHTALLS